MKKELSLLFILIFVYQFSNAFEIKFLDAKNKFEKFYLQPNKLNSSGGDGIVRFNDHQPIWFVTSGADICTMKLHLQENIQTPKMANPGINQEGVTGGISLGVGCNMPIMCVGENFALTISTHSAVAFSDEYASYKLPAYLKLHLGKGCNQDTDAEYIVAIGAGYSFVGFQYFDQFHYGYTELSPAFMFEAGYNRFIFRIDYTPNTHHAQFYDVSYAEFKSFSIGSSIYF